MFNLKISRCVEILNAGRKDTKFFLNAHIKPVTWLSLPKLMMNPSVVDLGGWVGLGPPQPGDFSLEPGTSNTLVSVLVPARTIYFPKLAILNSRIIFHTSFFNHDCLTIFFTISMYKSTTYI